MSALTVAASASEIVERIGSYAGYASIIGLGVLALLYFTQAREVKRLREWAGRAPERDAGLAGRVQADAQRRVVAQPLAPSSAAGQQADAARAAAAAAAVYASIGAQPPGSTPPPGQLARPAPPATGTPAPGAPPPGAVPAAPGAPVPAPSSAAAGAPAPGTLPAAPAPAAAAGTPTPGTGPVVTATPSPGPAPAPSPAAATAAARIAATSRAVVLPNGATSQDTTESAAARPDPMPYRPATGVASGGDEGGGFGMSSGRVAMIVGGGVAVIVVAIVLMVVLTGGEEPAPPNDFGNTPSAQEPADPPASSGDEEAGPDAGSSASQGLTSAERRATNVAVLNGTTQTGLARSVGDKIQEKGYTISGVATNADQSVPTTIVAYTPGHEEAALAVAKAIGVDRGSVQAADVNTTVAADADVVVTVGSDKLG